MKKKSGVGAGLRLAAAFIIIIAAAFLMLLAVRNGGFDIKDIISGVSGKERCEEYFYDNSTDGAFALAGDSFAVLTGTSLRSFDRSGGEILNMLITFKDPHLSSAGEYCAAWDAGGDEIIFFTENGDVLKITASDEIISVTVNESGYLCVCTDETGYGGSVTVYNPNGTAVYKWSAGSSYVLTARMKGNSELMVLTIGTGGSDLVLMSMKSEEEQARYTYPGLLIDAYFVTGGVCAVSDSELVFLDKSMKQNGDYGFSGKTLFAYSMTGNRCALIISDYQTGGERRLIIVSDGTEQGSVPVGADASAVSSAGDYWAVLSGSSVSVFDMQGENLDTFDNIYGTNKVLVRENGEIIAAGDYSAVLLTENEKDG